MSRDISRIRLGSILVMIILICSGFAGIFFSNPDVNVNAESQMVHTTEKDFSNGTFDNISVIGKGDAAELQIDLSDINTWTKRSPGSSPAAGPYHSTATVWGTDKVVSFGGYWYYGGYYYNNETWVYDYSDNAWVRKFPLITPSPRYWHAIATISGTDKVLLYGGIYSTYLSDTWIYDLSDNAWTNLNPASSPGIRAYHAMAAVDGTSKVILFGGMPYYNTTWEYNYNTNSWASKSSNPSSYYRYYHSLSTIYGTDKVLLFGGYYYSYDETWVYDLSDDKWTRQYPAQMPCYRWYAAMAPIWGTDNVVMFGGYGYWYPYYTSLNDTWVYDYSENTWTQKITKQRPGAAYYHAMATIWGTDRVLLYGGYSPTYGYWSETWIYRHNLPTKNGTYISKPYDLGANSTFYDIDWFSDIPDPTNSSLRIQLRTAKTKEKLASKDFAGPDGNTESFYTSTPTNIWSGHNGDRWIQYKVFLNINVFTKSPCLKEVLVRYNCLPETIVIGPVSGSLITIGKPTFAWTFEDQDSNSQKAFQVIIANDTEFENIHYDSGIQTSQEQSWMFPTGTSYTEMTDGLWYWKVRTQDEDGSWTDYGKPWKLQIDTQPPSSAPITPINDGYYNSIPWLTGLASDPTPGSAVAKIEISIKRLTDNYFWTGTQWVPLNSWLSANGTNEWFFDARTVKWRSGAKYLIISRATDLANNIEIPGKGNEFTVDMDPSISKIEYPNNEVWLNKLANIEGTAMDVSGSGVSSVEVSIRCIKDENNWDGGEKFNYYWDGKAWKATEAWVTATGAEEWMYNSSSITLSTGNHYLIRCRSTDNSGNMEVPGTGIMFMYDSEPPNGLSIYINNGDEYTTSTQAILALTAEDVGSGVAQMSFSTDNIEWSSWESFNTSFELQLPAGDGKKTVYYRVRDYAKNVAKSVSDTIILDTTPPKDLLIRINGNLKYTSSKNVKLDLRGTDTLSGIADMSYSFDSINWQPWEPFKETRYITLKAGDGEKAVYFKLRDNAGNIAEPVYDSIILDTVPPHSLMLVINHGSVETNSTLVTLNVNAIDETSRVDMICFSYDGEVWTSWENYSLVMYHSLPSGDGMKIVYFKVRDSAGNIAEPVSATIKLNTKESVVVETPKVSGKSNELEFWILFLIIIIIILILVILGLIFKRRRRPEEIFPGAVTIKPGGMFAPIGPNGQIPTAIRLDQLPTTIAVGDSQQLAAAGTAAGTPILVKSAQGTTQIVQLPALPPAKIDRTEQTTMETFVAPAPSNQPQPTAPATPTPIVSTPIPPVATVASTSPAVANPAPASASQSQSPTPSPKPAPEVHLPGSTPQPQPQVHTPTPQPQAVQPTPAPTVAPQPTPTVATPVTPQVQAQPQVQQPQPTTEAKPAPQGPENKVKIKDIL